MSISRWIEMISIFFFFENEVEHSKNAVIICRFIEKKWNFQFHRFVWTSESAIIQQSLSSEKKNEQSLTCRNTCHDCVHKCPHKKWPQNASDMIPLADSSIIFVLWMYNVLSEIHIAFISTICLLQCIVILCDRKSAVYLALPRPALFCWDGKERKYRLHYMAV